MGKNLDIAQGVYYPNNKPSWDDVGGNGYLNTKGSHVGVPAGKDLYLANGRSLLVDSATGGAATSYLGNSGRWFKEAWVNTYRGSTVSVSGGVTGNTFYNLGGDYQLHRPNTTGGWARGMAVRNSAGTEVLAGAGVLGGSSDTSVGYYSIGFGNTWWDGDTNTVKFYPDGNMVVRGGAVLKGFLPEKGPAGWGLNMKLPTGSTQGIAGIKAGIGFHNASPSNDGGIYFWNRANNSIGGTYLGYWGTSALTINGDVKASNITARDIRMTNPILRSGGESLLDIINELRSEIAELKRKVG